MESVAALPTQESFETVIEIGGLPLAVHSDSASFDRILHQRYENFVRPHAAASIHFRAEIVAPPITGGDKELEVSFESGLWRIERGDFLAQWDPASGNGWVRQSANPYSFDSVLRIVHSLVLARTDGFLLHSASVIRNGRAFLFSGISGAGKTTITRLAPQDVTLLTDEISYVRLVDGAYRAFGTPFAGELGIPGENVRAPIAALYFLAKGASNQIRPLPPATITRMLLRNILFFAQDPALVSQVFARGCDFVARVPAYELTFRPDAAVWDLIQ
jgi:hypothetical protein